jgi:hypothetical protein
MVRGHNRPLRLHLVASKQFQLSTREIQPPALLSNSTFHDVVEHHVPFRKVRMPNLPEFQNSANMNRRPASCRLSMNHSKIRVKGLEEVVQL